MLRAAALYAGVFLSVAAGVRALRKFLLQKLRRSFARQTWPGFSCAFAASYYLPEGRFYAAPAQLKRRPRSSKALPVMLGLGASLLSASALSRKPPAALPANVSVLAALPVALSPRNIDNYELPAEAEIAGSGRALPLPARAKASEVKQVAQRDTADRGAALAFPKGEDRILSGGKTGSVLSLSRNMRPRLVLVNYNLHYAGLVQNRAVHNFAAALKSSGQEAYAVRFQPARRGAGKFQLTQGFVPAPRKQAAPVLPVPQILASLVTNEKPDILALGYASAPAGAALESPFDSILTEKADKNNGRFIPPVGKADHPWAAMPLPASVFEPKQQKCLAEAVYFEARSESLKGQAAVAQVVLNRVRNPAYPNNICDVVYQNVNWYNRCQFSFACDGKKHRVTELKPWRTAQAVAKAVSAGQIWLADIGSATHYHAVYVHPQWALLMDKMQKIGSHIFYRTKNGGWS